MAADGLGEQLLAGGAGGANRREDPAAGGVQLLVGRTRSAQRELVDAVAGEARMGMAVDEPRDRNQAAGVELVEVAEPGWEVSHRAGRGDPAVLAEDIGIRDDLDLAQLVPAERRSGAGRADELREVADEEAAQFQGRPGSSTRSGRQSGKAAYASRGSSVSSATPAPCFCASSETG